MKNTVLDLGNQQSSPQGTQKGKSQVDKHLQSHEERAMMKAGEDRIPFYLWDVC